MTRDQCEAHVAPSEGGHRCQFAAKYRHRTQAGDTVRVCGMHLRMLKHRERLGSDEDVVQRWREA